MLTPRELMDKVNRINPKGTIKEKKAQGKKVMRDHAVYTKDPLQRLEIKMFYIKGAGLSSEEETKYREGLIEFMNQPNLNIFDMDFNFHEHKDPESKVWHVNYTVVIQYAITPYPRKPLGYRLSIFVLPGDEKEMAKYYAEVSGSGDPVEEDGYIFPSSRVILNKEKVINKYTGVITYYYHSIKDYRFGEPIKVDSFVELPETSKPKKGSDNGSKSKRDAKKHDNERDESRQRKQNKAV